MTMQDWEQRLAGFLRLWDREILQDAGKVTAELAKAHAESEFEKYRIVQDRLFESDFDRVAVAGAPALRSARGRGLGAATARSPRPDGPPRGGRDAGRARGGEDMARAGDGDVSKHGKSAPRGEVTTRTKRPRAPRVKLPSEIPLDDGTRNGTEPWRDVDGIAFCHWDRWRLRLSLEEPEGLASIAREFRRRARDQRRQREVAEAMLAQVADLASRLTRLGRAPAEVLDAVERESTWLRDKAFRRVWHATTIYRTQAMERTPRKTLEARAREGNWAAFSVSPRPYFARLDALYRGGYFDYRGVGLVVLRLESEGDRMLMSATSEGERLAVRRAILGACIEAMAHVDDSGCDLGDRFREREAQYLEALRPYVELPGILRDLLELSTWEDYGLFHHIDAFLSQLSEAAADVAIRELARIIGELRAAGLHYQLGRARRLRALVLKSAVAEEASTSEDLDAE